MVLSVIAEFLAAERSDAGSLRRDGRHCMWTVGEALAAVAAGLEAQMLHQRPDAGEAFEITQSLLQRCIGGSRDEPFDAVAEFLVELGRRERPVHRAAGVLHRGLENAAVLEPDGDPGRLALRRPFGVAP